MLEALFEGVLQATTWGLSDKIGVTGKDGLVHESDVGQTIDANVYGLVIKDNIRISWQNVVSIYSVDGDTIDDEFVGLVMFELRGGLEISGLVVGAESHIGEYVRYPSCTDLDVLDLNPKEISGETLKRLKTGVDDVFWAENIANKIRGLGDVEIDETLLLSRMIGVWITATEFFEEINDDNCSLDDVFKTKILDILPTAERCQCAIREQLGHIKLDDINTVDKAVCDIIGQAFFWSAPTPCTGKSIKKRKEAYDALRSARSWGCDFAEDGILDLLTSSGEGHAPFGSEEWADIRKMIVCTDARSSLVTADRGVQIDNVMVMDARDIVAYNKSVGDDEKLKFEPSHPQNDVAYVQHPSVKNLYIQLRTYHTTMFDRKYEEMRHLLTCLGAKTFELSAESSSSIAEHCSQKQTMSGRVNVDMVGDASIGVKDSSGNSRLNALCKKFSTKRVLVSSGKPYVPTDVEFYPTEQSWQRLAELVLAGRIQSEEVSLSYRNESAVRASRLHDINVKLHSLVPGYSFGVEGNFEKEYSKELKTLESLTLNYKVVFNTGYSSGDFEADSGMNDKGWFPKDNKAESLISNRAKRYVKTDEVARSGMLTEAQRSDLEKLAMKYGIDEIRLEELIEEAFE